MSLHAFRIAADFSAIKPGSDPLQVRPIRVPARRKHLRQLPRRADDHQHTGCRRREHKAPATTGMAECKLLRERTAPGHTKYIYLTVIAQLVEQLDGEPGKPLSP